MDAKGSVAIYDKIYLAKADLPIGGATVAHSKQCANPAQNVSELDQTHTILLLQLIKT